jgi:hypothetical protein
MRIRNFRLPITAALVLALSGCATAGTSAGDRFRMGAMAGLYVGGFIGGGVGLASGGSSECDGCGGQLTSEQRITAGVWVGALVGALVFGSISAAIPVDEPASGQRAPPTDAEDPGFTRQFTPVATGWPTWAERQAAPWAAVHEAGGIPMLSR